MTSGARNQLSLIRKALLPAVALLIIGNFVGYAVMGDNGVLSWGDYRRMKQERGEQLARLEAEKARLSHRSDLLDPRHTDPDLAEEMVRSDLGYVRPDEVIIEIPPQVAAQPRSESQREARAPAQPQARPAR